MRSALLLIVFTLSGVCAERHDFVVYGGTAGGVMTAVSAAREGLDVALLEPGRHVGGMLTGGLSFSDVGRNEVIGGLALEFFRRAGAHYGMRRFGHDVSWYFEPHIGEEILAGMLREAGVKVYYGRRLREKNGVLKNGSRVVSITTETGEVFEARIFADTTYEGDLMAQAGVSYTWGREGVSGYGESLAGVRERTPFHQFLVPVRAYHSDGTLLPEISPNPRGAAGSADRKVQAYNFRLCITDDPANLVPFPKPDAYHPARYELLARLLEARTKAEGAAPRFGTLASIDAIPNRKADVNNKGAFSTDYIGKSWEYPEAGYARRAQIWQDHVNYVQGFFWFLAHDERVPESLRNEVNSWGLAKDEFVDNGNWPRQLYIREARRMRGDFVMTQKDLQTDLTKPDAIGMGSYNSDSHNVQRIANSSGFVENEGDVQVPVTPYQIPYRIMLPKRAEAENLLVPVCFSASHVAYSSVRMEPQYMILGHAAGLAARIAIASGKPLHDIDPAALRQSLLKQGAVLRVSASSR